jgi:A/G-specific adenine glycosylase
MSSLDCLAPAELKQLRRSLLSWYGRNQRDLPWRRTRDPYRVWVSEIMLQQTRAAAVVDRYAKFLDRFPAVQDLAAARESAVLAAWSGLGYYRRARNLHAAAKIVVRRNQGTFPRDAASWRELPGVGRYTAAAIASIAFGEPVAVVDGNVERVLRRLLGREFSKGNLWDTAQSMLAPTRAGDFNQAMMELGATICVPHEPQCSMCPIKKICRTRGPGHSPRRKAPQRKEKIVYGLALRADSVCLVRRASNTRLMPGMWELPEVASRKPSDEVLFTLAHSITVTNFNVLVVRGKLRLHGSWVKISRLSSLPLTGLARKILHTAKIIQ